MPRNHHRALVSILIIGIVAVIAILGVAYAAGSGLLNQNSSPCKYGGNYSGCPTTSQSQTIVVHSGDILMTVFVEECSNGGGTSGCFALSNAIITVQIPNNSTILQDTTNTFGYTQFSVPQNTQITVNYCGSVSACTKDSALYWAVTQTQFSNYQWTMEVNFGGGFSFMGLSGSSLSIFETGIALIVLLAFVGSFVFIGRGHKRGA